MQHHIGIGFIEGVVASEKIIGLGYFCLSQKILKCTTTFVFATTTEELCIWELQFRNKPTGSIEISNDPFNLPAQLHVNSRLLLFCFTVILYFQVAVCIVVILRIFQIIPTVECIVDLLNWTQL